MQHIPIFHLLLGAFILLLLTACPDVIEDLASTSIYVIDNQTSVKLSYQLADPDIDISIGVIEEIGSLFTIENSGIHHWIISKNKQMALQKSSFIVTVVE